MTPEQHQPYQIHIHQISNNDTLNALTVLVGRQEGI